MGPKAFLLCYITIPICWHIARLLVWLPWPCVSWVFDLWPTETTYVAPLTPFGKITLFMTKRLCLKQGGECEGGRRLRCHPLSVESSGSFKSNTSMKIIRTMKLFFIHIIYEKSRIHLEQFINLLIIKILIKTKMWGKLWKSSVYC